MDPDCDAAAGRRSRYEYESEELLAPTERQGAESNTPFGEPFRSPTLTRTNNSEFSFGYSRAAATLSEEKIETLRYLIPTAKNAFGHVALSPTFPRQCRIISSASNFLLPLKSWSPASGAVVDVGNFASQLDLGTLTQQFPTLYERLLVGRAVARALAELHSANFWCGRVTLDAINTFSMQPRLAKYCLEKSGGYSVPSELIAQDIRDLGLRTHELIES